MLFRVAPYHFDRFNALPSCRMRRAISTSPDTRATRANGGYIGENSFDNMTCPCGNGIATRMRAEMNAVGRIIPLRTVEKTVGGRVQNLKPWPKGVSGNPAGRPKGDISVEIARAVFENDPEAIYRGMLRRLKKGDARVFKVLADRAYGKVKDQLEVDVSKSIVEQLQAGRRRALEGLSEAELRDRIETLQRQLALKSGRGPGDAPLGALIRAV